MKTFQEEPQTPPEMTEPVLDNESTETVFALSEVPAYNGEPYVAINGNTPYFTDDDLTTTSFETYSPLDDLGRCGVTYACVGQDIMPTEERGSIGQVKPTRLAYREIRLRGRQISVQPVSFDWVSVDW